MNEGGLKYSPCSTEWIEVYYKRTCENILVIWSHLFMISTCHKVMEPTNYQKQTIKPTYFIVWLSIEYKSIYL